MRILFHLHAYPPHVMAGAETMAHRIAKYLLSKGHEIKVYSQTAKGREFIDSIEVNRYDKSVNDDEHWEWADLVITHLGATPYCLNKSRFWKKKLVHLIHNSFFDQLTCCRVINNYLVYNSPYVKRELEARGYSHENTICIPPVNYREYTEVKKGDYITLVNLNENKGGKIFIEIAKRLPQYKFLGVTGGYYEQNKEKLPNLKYIPQQTDIRKAYAQTRLLVMPSEYESWGQVAIEALSCSIPVITSPAQGLCEATGKAGFSVVDRDNIDHWVTGIKLLMEDQALYEKYSILAKGRAIELDPLPYLENLERFLTDVNKKSWI